MHPQDRLASGEQIFGPLLQKHLLQNQHKVSARVLPDKQLGSQQDEAEKAKLEQRMKAMSPQDLEAAVAETAELKHRQVSLSHACLKKACATISETM